MLGGANEASDPFNYPMPQRGDTMSLSTINNNRDNMATSTKKFNTKRYGSSNLDTSDITGTFVNQLIYFRCITQTTWI